MSKFKSFEEICKNSVRLQKLYQTSMASIAILTYIQCESAEGKICIKKLLCSSSDSVFDILKQLVELQDAGVITIGDHYVSLVEGGE